MLVWLVRSLELDFLATVIVTANPGNLNMSIQNEPRSEKTNLRGFRPVPLQTSLYGHRRWLEA